jgi:hypothetical protein
MSYILSPAGVRGAGLGVRTDRATAALPQTATGSIFTVSGGRIVLTSLVGEVTTVLGATVTTLTVVSTPTTGAATTLASATAVTSSAVGSWFTLPATLGSALVVTPVAGAVALPTRDLGFLVPVGAIQLTTSASDTGSVKWSLTYVPFDDAATVVAA